MRAVGVATQYVVAENFRQAGGQSVDMVSSEQKRDIEEEEGYKRKRSGARDMDIFVCRCRVCTTMRSYDIRCGDRSTLLPCLYHVQLCQVVLAVFIPNADDTFSMCMFVHLVVYVSDALYPGKLDAGWYVRRYATHV